MLAMLPFLNIQSPDGNSQRIDLRKTQYTIGRFPDNDIALPGGSDSPITRIEHCLLERETGRWYLIDKSTNGTVLKRGDQSQQVQDLPDRKVVLNRGDIICIHGWTLTFDDPNGTGEVGERGAKSLVRSPFVYKVTQAALYYQGDGTRTPIEPRPQVNKMLRYMAQRNLENGGEPVICNYEELIHAVWSGEDAQERTNGDINGIAREIRKLFDEKPSSEDGKQFLETRKGEGYLLRIATEW